MKRWLVIITLLVIFLAGVFTTKAEWQGTDDSVIGPMAEKAGVEEKQILPWTLEGDLELFVFCTGGAVAGFAAGYYWRQLFSKNSKRETA